MTAETTPAPTTDDPVTLALLRNDLGGLTKTQIGALVASMAERMGVPAELAPVDVIPTKYKDANGQWREKLSLYINARGASELAKRRDLSDSDLDVDVRDRVVIVKATKRDPATGRIVRDVGAAAFEPDQPATLAKAIKTATTSAHRRSTMRAVGIFLNEPADLLGADDD